MSKKLSGLNSTVKMTLNNGDKVNLACNWSLLIKLKQLSPDLYNQFMQVMTKGANDLLDVLPPLYACYICGVIKDNDGDISGALSQDDFISLCPFDMQALGDTFMSLFAPKNQAANLQTNTMRPPKN